MKDTATRFFATGATFALCGMIWGIVMSATHDHTLSPAHGHLNLIGFVVMTVFGTFYALTPRAAASRLADIHYLLTVAAVLIIVPGIAMAISGSGEAPAKIGSVLALAAMAYFVFMVFRFGVGTGNRT
jgi:cbb3-type cytochrome oxidase subunit 1